MDAASTSFRGLPPRTSLVTGAERRWPRAVVVVGLRTAIVACAVALFAVQLQAAAGGHPREAALLALFAGLAAVEITRQWLAIRVGKRRLREAHRHVDSFGYVDEDLALPNRNHILFELRAAMPEARASGRPFVLAEISIGDPQDVDVLPDVRRQLARRLGTVLQTITRRTDLLARLSDEIFCVLLLECSEEQAELYLNRLPTDISARAGDQRPSAPVTIRLLEYDLESLYATDQLRELAIQPVMTRRALATEQRRRARRRGLVRAGPLAESETLWEFLRGHYRIALRHRLPLSVAVLTVRGPAEVAGGDGDTGAHALLRRVALHARARSRTGDLVAWHGPSMLALVCPGLTAADTSSILLSLQHEVAAWPAVEGDDRAVELAFGVAELAEKAVSPEGLVAAAEAAIGPPEAWNVPAASPQLQRVQERRGRASEIADATRSNPDDPSLPALQGVADPAAHDPHLEQLQSRLRGQHIAELALPPKPERLTARTKPQSVGGTPLPADTLPGAPLSPIHL